MVARLPNGLTKTTFTAHQASSPPPGPATPNGQIGVVGWAPVDPGVRPQLSSSTQTEALLSGQPAALAAVQGAAFGRRDVSDIVSGKRNKQDKNADKTDKKRLNKGRERNRGHEDGEEHSRVSKGGNRRGNNNGRR